MLAPLPRRGILARSLLPLAFALALATLGLLPSVRQNPNVLVAVLGAAGILCVWNFVLSLSRRRAFSLEISLKKQHYMQACGQGLIMLYWGWYWPQVYEIAPLLLAQLLFAYAFDMLFCWSRRDIYTLGFGPFPI